jgi:transcriptional regulator with XRE-family HTH domain
MRRAGDHLSVGARIAFSRRRRGLSRRVLAHLVGRSEDWLSTIERGEPQVRRLDGPARRDALMAPPRLSRFADAPVVVATERCRAVA